MLTGVRSAKSSKARSLQRTAEKEEGEERERKRTKMKIERNRRSKGEAEMRNGRKNGSDTGGREEKGANGRWDA